MDWSRLVHRMKADGHQIASHTWSHQRLPTLSRTLLRNQMIYNEIAIADILGFFPTYMRPPYSASNEDVDRWLGELGYHVTYFDLDTEGYLHDNEEDIEISKGIVDRYFEGKDSEDRQYLHIEHDTVYETVSTLVAYTIEALHNAGFTTATVGGCLGDPEENWYRWPDDEKRKRAVTEVSQDPSQARSVSGETSSAHEKVRSSSDQLRHIHNQIRSVPFKSGLDGNGSFSHPPTPFNRTHSGIHHPATDDGRCGPAFRNTTCFYQKSERCCSKSSWCGATEDHCFEGCQEKYGVCGMDF